MEFDLTRPRRSNGPALRRVKAWAEQALRLSDDSTVMVTELRCSEEGCPPVETVIAIVGGPEKQRQGKVACPADEVVLAQVEAVCAALLAGASIACDHADTDHADADHADADSEMPDIGCTD
jgi:hypothetical protein